MGCSLDKGRSGAGATSCRLQYKNVRPDYVDRLWNLVNWADVTKRFAAARAAGNPIILAP